MANGNNTRGIKPEDGVGSANHPIRLDEALVKLRRTLNGHHCCDDLNVGDKWKLGEGLGLSLVLISKPLYSPSSPADEPSRRYIR